jgi:hypothetical protein
LSLNKLSIRSRTGSPVSIATEDGAEEDIAQRGGGPVDALRACDERVGERADQAITSMRVPKAASDDLGRMLAFPAHGRPGNVDWVGDVVG